MFSDGTGLVEEKKKINKKGSAHRRSRVCSLVCARGLMNSVGSSLVDNERRDESKHCSSSFDFLIRTAGVSRDHSDHGGG